MGILQRNNKTYSGAGVMVVEKYRRSNGMIEPCIILVRSKASGLYMDFGGSYETKHGGLRVTATSELREESRNLLCVSPLKLTNYVDIPSGNHQYRSYVVRIEGISRKYFNYNASHIDKSHKKGIKVPRSWRETDDIRHIPLAGINLVRLSQRGMITLNDVDGAQIHIHGRAKTLILHSYKTILKVLANKPIGRYSNMHIQKSTDWKNNTYRFNLK
jgi:hypothetical protein